MFSAKELREVAGEREIGGVAPNEFPGAAIDSRQTQPGELFVALRGTALDGHRFIAAAVDAGAGAILCAQVDETARARGVPQFVVDDPLATLQELARRRLLRQPYTHVVGVAGSNGKTSVKEAVALVLATQGPTLKTTGNLNTETGVPVSLLRLRTEHQFAVIEMGAQTVGEVAALCRIAPPELGVVTVVGPEHLEFFGSMANVVQAEGEIIDALAPDGVAVLNADDPDVLGMAARARARVMTYGQSPSALVRAENITGDTLTGMRFTLRFQNEAAPVALLLTGAHAVTTALAAAAVGVAYEIPLAKIARALGEARPAKRRGEIKQGAQGSVLIDDSYNANKQSAIAALATLQGAQLAPGARRWFVLGDMLELGDFSPAEHAGVGDAAATSALDELVLVGDAVRHTADAALASGMALERVHLFLAPLDDAAELLRARHAAATFVRERLEAHDLVLVKGSLGVGMDVVVAGLLAAETPPSADH